MTPHFFSGSTGVLGAPEDWDHDGVGECTPLPVMRDGRWMVSVWKPSADELATLNRGGAISLHIAGHVHPVVALGAVEPDLVSVSV